MTRFPPLALLVASALVARAAGDYCSSPTSCVQAGFCNDVAHIDTLGAQPEAQHERWELPFVNETHLIIRWSPGRQLCGQTLDSYMVSLNSSSRVFNYALSIFGSFPQDTCADSSPARAATSRAAVNPCGTYARRCTHEVTETVVRIQPYMWQGFGWAPNNLTVQAMAYGTIRGGRLQPSRSAPLWCISFRKYNPRQGGLLSGRRGGPGALVARARRWWRQSMPKWTAALSRAAVLLMAEISPTTASTQAGRNEPGA